jgi:hypothetical protein
MYAPGATDLVVERLSVKDQYETPAQLWRYAIEAFSLDRDAHASSLNAVLPAYSTRLDTSIRAGARYWINPAYGGHCVTIGAALAAHVWVDGCAVVALLPALLHTDWCGLASPPLPRARAHTVAVPTVPCCVQVA